MGERLALVSVGDTQQQEPSNKVPDSSNGHLGGGGGVTLPCSDYSNLHVRNSRLAEI